MIAAIVEVQGRCDIIPGNSCVDSGTGYTNVHVYSVGAPDKKR